MLNSNSVSRFTSFCDCKNIFLEPQFNIQTPFTEKMIQLVALKSMAKIVLITGASAGFGIMMGLIMSSFETSNAQIVDNTRSTRSQLKQHFFGYGRFLKRQALHFAKFGLYISLIELPLEMVKLPYCHEFRYLVELTRQQFSSVEELLLFFAIQEGQQLQ